MGHNLQGMFHPSRGPRVGWRRHLGAGSKTHLPGFPRGVQLKRIWAVMWDLNPGLQATSSSLFCLLPFITGEAW